MQEESSEEKKDFNEMIGQLKEKFEQSSTTDQIKILTVLPKSWSQRKIAEEFGTTRHKASVAKKLVAEKGVLCDPNPKQGKEIEKEVVDTVERFYRSEDVSRMMPGKKDVVSLKVNGERKHIQKQLILCNLKELYALFRERNPDIKVGFSKFAELRPKECVLVGASGTHSVCVCTTHQNMKLMFEASKIEQMTKNEKKHLMSPQDCLPQIQCNPPSIECCLGECSNCGNDENLRALLEKLFDDNIIEEVTFKHWTHTDRSQLETVVKPVDDFVNQFLKDLKVYQRHAFLAKSQSAFYRDKKENLEDGEVLVVCDFAENYSFVVQDEIQSFHWNNDMVTLHPFVGYYKEGEQISHINFVVISECNIHDTVSVHLFIKLFLQHLKVKLPDTKKVIYISDGCAGQYKNCKNFLNLCLHEKDFNLKAEWHFFATSHGKGPCDGLGKAFNQSEKCNKMY